MVMIAAVDKKWAIGRNGNLLVNIPEDMKLFRQETVGKIVIMGRKTFESLPGKTALVDRTNIVISKNPKFNPEGVIVVRSIEEAVSKARELSSKEDESDIIVCGGGQIYEEMISYCDVAHITKIDYVYDADTFFPNLDKDSDWEISERSDEHTYFDICYEFIKYSRI